MITSSAKLNNIVMNTWVKASWQEFLNFADDPNLDSYKFYYYEECMRIEMSAVGPRHGHQNSIIPLVVILFAALKNIKIVQFTNTSFRKQGLTEFQPELAYYIGSDLKVPPDDSNSPVNLDEWDPPTLVVEIGASSVSDDIGWKRLLYERANVREYWVNDANRRSCIAFSVSEGRSGEIQESQVLPGLAIAVVAEALKRSQTQDDGEITRWLLQSFS